MLVHVHALDRSDRSVVRVTRFNLSFRPCSRAGTQRQFFCSSDLRQRTGLDEDRFKKRGESGYVSREIKKDGENGNYRTGGAG